MFSFKMKSEKYWPSKSQELNCNNLTISLNAEISFQDIVKREFTLKNLMLQVTELQIKNSLLLLVKLHWGLLSFYNVYLKTILLHFLILIWWISIFLNVFSRKAELWLSISTRAGLIMEFPKLLQVWQNFVNLLMMNTKILKVKTL